MQSLIRRKIAEISFAPRPPVPEPDLKPERWNALVKKVGVRYAACRLGNFEVTNGEQKTVADGCAKYCREITDNMKSGRNVLLYGPPGTGKDHLMVAMMRVAIAANFTVSWHNGLDLFAGARDLIDSGGSEDDFWKPLASADVLALSDPLLPDMANSGFQKTSLLRILDRRYRDMKPTWVTINVKDSEEATARIGAATVDRLSHGALCCYCNWPSYRRG